MNIYNWYRREVEDYSLEVTDEMLTPDIVGIYNNGLYEIDLILGKDAVGKSIFKEGSDTLWEDVVAFFEGLRKGLHTIRVYFSEDEKIKTRHVLGLILGWEYVCPEIELEIMERDETGEYVAKALRPREPREEEEDEDE